MGTKRIIYYLIGAYNAGNVMHPEEYIESIGIKVLSYEGHPIQDCVVMEVDRMPEGIDYIAPYRLS